MFRLTPMSSANVIRGLSYKNRHVKEYSHQRAAVIKKISSFYKNNLLTKYVVK